MKIFGARFVTVAGLVGMAGLLTNVNCSSSTNGTGTAGTGGGKAGTTGTAGKGGAAGTSATGTAGAAGGESGTTGTAGHGGASGSAGGTTGTAGAGGAAGGTAGTGGGSGPFDGGAITGTSLATFDPADGGSSDLDGFAINIYDNGPGNLDVATDGGAAATLIWTGSQGDPAVGSLEINAPFHAYKEFVDIQKVYPTTGLQNWTGKTKLHVRVKVASGLNPNTTFPPGVQPYAQSYSAAVDGGAAAAYHNCSTYTNVPAGNGWNTFTVDFSGCGTPFDLTKIIEFGVEIQTGDGPTADAGSVAVPTAAIVYVDSFSVE
jgi:hypothetical protein